MCLSPFPCICLLLYADFALLARGIHRQAVCQPYQRYAEYKPKQAIFDAFADKSVAAMESLDLDERTFGNIIEEEIDRINAKNGKQ